MQNQCWHVDLFQVIGKVGLRKSLDAVQDDLAPNPLITQKRPQKHAEYGLKIKEEKKTENRAFLTARCHNEGRSSREVSGQDRPQSCRRNSQANLLVRPPLPQQVSPSLGIVRSEEH